MTLFTVTAAEPGAKVERAPAAPAIGVKLVSPTPESPSAPIGPGRNDLSLLTTRVARTP